MWYNHHLLAWLGELRFYDGAYTSAAGMLAAENPNANRQVQLQWLH